MEKGDRISRKYKKKRMLMLQGEVVAKGDR